MKKQNKEDFITSEGTKDAKYRANINLLKAKLIEQNRLKNGAKYIKINKGFKLINPK